MGRNKRKKKKSKHKPPLKKAQIAMPPSTFAARRRIFPWWWLLGGSLVFVFAMAAIALRLVVQLAPGPPMNKYVHIVRPSFESKTAAPRVTITEVYPRRVIVGESAAAHVYLRADATSNGDPLEAAATMDATGSTVQPVQDSSYTALVPGSYGSYEYAITPKLVGSIITTLHVSLKSDDRSSNEKVYTEHAIINAIPTDTGTPLSLATVSNLCGVISLLWTIATYLFDRWERKHVAA